VDFLRDWIMNRGVRGGARNGGRAPSGGGGGGDVYVELRRDCWNMKLIDWVLLRDWIMIEGVFGGARNGGSEVFGGARGCGGVTVAVVVALLRISEELVEKVVVVSAVAADVSVVAALDIFFSCALVKQGNRWRQEKGWWKRHF
jgi:hypothetical protein